jgi:hypothetical protein
MALWSYGVFVSCCYGIVILWSYGDIELWSYEIMALWRIRNHTLGRPVTSSTERGNYHKNCQLYIYRIFCKLHFTSAGTNSAHILCTYLCQEKLCLLGKSNTGNSCVEYRTRRFENLSSMFIGSKAPIVL